MAKIYVPDIECDSCVKLISRKFNEQGVTGFKIDDESVSLDDASKEEHAIRIIEGLGYRASKRPFERKTFSERLSHFKENGHKYVVEQKGVQYTIGVFIILEFLFLLAYFGFLKNIPGFMQNFGWWVLYLIISVSAIGYGLWHFYSYRVRVSCMSGMMIGMTFGMQTGMMIGAVVGATNGFFVGAMTGMVLGVFVGFLTGKCCGIMGIMEGMMAGLMGGTMGPMISVMMLFDNVLVFMPFYMLVNLGIIAGLSYMFYEEVVEKSERADRRPVDFVTYASLSVIVVFVISIIIIYGPKSSLITG